MFSIRKRVLLVGAEGFIGSHLPVAKSYFEKWDKIDLKSGQDFRNLVDILPYYDFIIFLAVDMGQTQEAYKYNESLYRALDSYMTDHPDTHVIYTSSAAVYSDSKAPHVETDAPAPANWYGDSKWAGERHVAQYRHHTILRLSNVYGYGDGKGVVDRFLRGERAIYGSGRAVRDYIPVEVVALAIDSAMALDWHGIINISSGRGRSVNELWKILGKSKPVKLAKRPGDVAHSVLDNTKFNNLVGGDHESD